MPTEMKIICPHCGYGHEKELSEDLESFVSPGAPYESECLKCGEWMTVTTHVNYLFSAIKSS